MFVIWSISGPDADTVRARVRAEHLRFVLDRRDCLVFGGACMDEAGERMAGMLMVVALPDAEAVRAFIAAEPYSREGAFASITFMPFAQRVPEPEAGFLLAELLAEERRYS